MSGGNNQSSGNAPQQTGGNVPQQGQTTQSGGGLAGGMENSMINNGEVFTLSDVYEKRN